MSVRRPKDEKLTMAAIAALAGVSKPTVSKVMNGQPGVAAATRERVKRVIAEQRYVRNGVARALSAGRVGSVNLVMSEIDSPYFVEILRGVEETLDNAGLSMVLTTTHDEARRHRRWMARVVEHGTEGVVLVLPDEHAAPLEDPFRGRRRPRRESFWCAVGGSDQLRWRVRRDGVSPLARAPSHRRYRRPGVQVYNGQARG